MALRNHKALLLTALLACTYASHTTALFAQDADQAEAEEEAREQAAKEEALKEQRRKAPPTALPGAQGDGGDMGHANFDVSPTDALFDAINRGSLLAAKEAIGRGADIKSRNVIGQTPLDMAIDLNRNDITFLLLSLRSQNEQSDVITEVVPLEKLKHGNATAKKLEETQKISPPKPQKSKPNFFMGFLGF